MPSNGSADTTQTTEPAISIESVSKRYRAGRRPSTVPVPISLPFGLGGRGDRRRDRGDAVYDDDDDELELEEEEEEEDLPPELDRDIWAVRDLSLEVAPGASLGLVGPNGAGKTTLLKMIARVTPPTSGRIVTRGRLASLLGSPTSFFQPGRTGRQNVYGLARFFDIPREVAERNMEEIFAFADIPELIDSKAAAYSSGQYQRFGFAAALHLEPDILLAQDRFVVGDPDFQDRALERFEEASRAGRTMLYASNDHELIERICDEVLWMEDGQIVERGTPDDVMSRWDELRLARKATLRAAAPGPTDAPPSTEPDEPEPALEVAEPVEPLAELDEEAALFVSFLTVAIGEYQTTAALEDARRAVAASDRGEQVRLSDLAVAAGYGRVRARQIAARLREHEFRSSLDGKRPASRVFNKHLAIVTGRVLSKDEELISAVRTDEAAWLRVILESATPDLGIRCTFVIRSRDNEPIRIVQPNDFAFDEAGSWKVSAYLPAGLLADGAYSCDVTTRVLARGSKSEVRRRSVFQFDAYDPGEDSGDDPGEPFGGLDQDTVEWRVKKVKGRG